MFTLTCSQKILYNNIYILYFSHLFILNYIQFVFKQKLMNIVEASYYLFSFFFFISLSLYAIFLKLINSNIKTIYYLFLLESQLLNICLRFIFLLKIEIERLIYDNNYVIK